MKKALYLFSILFLSYFAVSLTSPVFAQEDLPVQEEITDGREYWVGIPNCLRDAAEAVRWGTYPIELWLSSKVDQVAIVESADGSLFKNIPLKANRVTVVHIPDFLENTESEVVRLKGINIRGPQPLNVAVFVAYKWSGEAFRCTPNEWLGTKYYTLNMWQDNVKMASGYTEYKPSQILIVATEDNTLVKFKPTAETDKGVVPGETKSVKLNKGDTYLILAKVKNHMTHNWATDLSGTFIDASKPVAVISGHTKGAFPAFKEVFLGSLKSDFMRNMLSDAMWPVELLGKEYLSAPLKYLNRYYNTGNMVEDLTGDLIRFVATEDNTTIYQMRQDGSGFMQISPSMKAGQWYDIKSMDKAAYYKANKKILVGQYGKAWWSNTVKTGKDENGDETLNPPRNGQPCMFALTPIEQWTSYSVFRVPFGMDNFVYFTFKIDDFDKLYFDGKKFTSVFGSVYKVIEGTDYGYVTEFVSAGDHFVEGKNGGKFAGYAYGNWDASKDGFAYGYPIGINYSQPCVDSLYDEHEIVCGDVAGTVYATPPDSSCAAIFAILVLEKQNYQEEIEEFDPKKAKVVNFWLKVIDKAKAAKATVKFVTRSGKSITRTYEYFPEEIEATPTDVNFGLLSLGEQKCSDVTIKNPGRFPIDVTVKDIKLMYGKPEFELKVAGLPYTLKPGETKTFEVCATALVLSDNPVTDSIIFVLECYEKALVKLEMRTGEPIVWIDDAKWIDIPVKIEKPQQVRIENESNIPATLTSITWKDNLHFTRVEGLNFPLYLEPYGHHTFTVYYRPDVAGVQHIDTAWFASDDVSKRKLWSEWIGNGIEAGPYIEGYDWFKKRVIDNFSVNNLGVTRYEGTVVIDNVTETNTKLDYVDVVIENDFGGVFTIDKSKAPTQLNPNSPVTFPVYFAPKENDGIEEYITKISFIAKFNNETKIANAELHGIETQPHIQIDGYDFGSPILVGETAPGQGKIISFSASELSAMPLTITDVKIANDNDNAFAIDPQFFVDNPYPIVIQPGRDLDVPIIFTAKRPGDHVADLIAEHDAPEVDKGELIGRGLTVGIDATDYEYPVRYITTTSPEASVYFTNNGSKDAIIDHAITISGPDGVFFNLTRITHSNGTVNPASPIVLKQKESLKIDFTFTPFEVRAYEAQIDYITNVGNEVSILKGSGMDHWVKAKIPTNYIGKPGDEVAIEVIIDQHSKETKPLAQADIREFKAIINFKQPGSDPNVHHVFPSVTSVNDIYTNNSMTTGWRVISADVMNKSQLVVHFEANQALAGSGTLFRFPLRIYLSDMKEIVLPVEFEPVGRPYVFVEEDPGLVKIQPVCVNNLRLIKLSDVRYTMASPTPNPVSENTTINYSIALDGYTNITLFDSFGNKIETLVNQNQEKGSYEMTINVSNLPSGNYYYRIESGPFTDTKQLLIVK